MTSAQPSTHEAHAQRAPDVAPVTSPQDIKAQVRVYILDNFVMAADGGEFGDADSFIENHIIDSTGFLELVSYLEERFGLRVEDEEMVPANLDSLDAVAAYVRRKCAA